MVEAAFVPGILFVSVLDRLEVGPLVSLSVLYVYVCVYLSLFLQLKELVKVKDEEFSLFSVLFVLSEKTRKGEGEVCFQNYSERKK